MNSKEAANLTMERPVSVIIRDAKGRLFDALVDITDQPFEKALELAFDQLNRHNQDVIRAGAKYPVAACPFKVIAVMDIDAASRYMGPQNVSYPLFGHRRAATIRGQQ